MADSSKSLEELKLLWESDPSSKVYLQLARAYREAGQLEDAVQVLETSLEHRPRDPRGRVALARCHLEAGRPQPAADLLEEVIRQDAAHVDANKLLLECYLRLGDAEKADERMNIYRLLNDRDPELDHLQYRLENIGEEGSSAPEPPPVESAPEPPPVESAPEPPPVESAPEVPPVESVPVETAPEPPSADAVPDIPPVESAPEPDPVEEAVPEAEHEDDDLFEAVDDEPAPADDAPEAPAALPDDEDLFGLSASADEVEVAEEPVLFELWEQTETVQPVAPEPAAPEPAAPEPVAPEPVEEIAADEAAEIAAEEDRAEEETPEEGATATLGRLYLRQGHLDEAEEIFRDVLRRDPQHAEARQGLDEVAAAREPEIEEPETREPELEEATAGERGLDGQALLSEVALSGNLPGDPNGRKIAVLQQYLKHLRSGEPDHVH